MATLTSTTAAINGTTIWSDRLPKFICMCGREVYVKVQVYAADGLLLEDWLYSYTGSVELSLKDIVTEELRLQGLFMTPVKVLFIEDGSTTASLTFTVLYRSGVFASKADDFTSVRFLSLCDSKQLPAGGIDSVAALLQPGETVTFSIEQISRDANGNFTGRNVYSSTIGAGLASPKLTSWPVRWFPEKSPEGAIPVAMVATAGARRMVYYMLPVATDIFRFANVFNCTEYLYARASISSKLSHEASVGAVDHTLLRYDLKQTEEFTAQFGPTLPEDIRTLAQLSESPAADWCDWRGEDPSEEEWRRIIVTSAEWTRDTDPSEPAQPKLTFRLADPDPLTYLGSGYGLRRVHTEPFNETFN